jgi:hypothetical protein
MPFMDAGMLLLIVLTLVKAVDGCPDLNHLEIGVKRKVGLELQMTMRMPKAMIETLSRQYTVSLLFVNNNAL